MDEQEFDSLMQSRPFERKDAIQVDVQLRRCITLAIALRGRTLDDLQRRLLAPSPEIPSGFDLADFRDLQIYRRNLPAICPSRKESLNVCRTKNLLRALC
jgi:hypothetical protein